VRHRAILDAPRAATGEHATDQAHITAHVRLHVSWHCRPDILTDDPTGHRALQRLGATQNAAG
jgi:hypothetical protein